MTLTLALTALALRAAPAQTPQSPDARPGIAVLDYDIGMVFGQDREDYDALRRGLASLTITELSSNPAIRVVERSQLQQILQEQNLGHEGRIDEATQSRIGRLVGARYMITGTLFDNRGDVRVDTRIFDTETGVILRTQSVRGHMTDLFEMLPRLAQQLMHDANLPPLDRHAEADFRQQNPAPPTQAVMAFSRAVLYADRGETSRAVEQYKRALAVFPQYTQARTDCNRLQAGACSS
ncbi:MAG TPA: CsgG/HfaB family protein [Gemmatimonadales bacterium]|jgi:TolB-like protein